MFLSPQRLCCKVSADFVVFISGSFILTKPFFGVIFLMMQKLFESDKK